MRETPHVEGSVAPRALPPRLCFPGDMPCASRRPSGPSSSRWVRPSSTHSIRA